jgi:hypothetical protein
MTAKGNGILVGFFDGVRYVKYELLNYIIYLFYIILYYIILYQAVSIHEMSFDADRLVLFMVNRSPRIAVSVCVRVRVRVRVRACVF